MISLCIIAKDEEDNISRCINSVKDIVDEIIVVDTGSRDRTKDIAKSLGAKIFSFRWIDDFSAARNFALSKCTKDWILILDADETISKKDLEKIKDLTKEKNIAYRFIQRTYSNKKSKNKWNSNDNSYEESKGFKGWQYRGIVRLFKNIPEIKFIYPIHETVKPSILKLGKIIGLDIPIHHFPKDYKTKQDLYLKLLEKKIKDHPTANSFAELSVHLSEIGRKKEAESFAKKAKELNPKINLKI